MGPQARRGYGYINEYEIAQLWGTPGCSGSTAGATEIMGRSLGF